MAADSGQRETALRHLGGGIVRTTRTIVSRPRRRTDCFFQYRFLGFQKTQTRLDEVALMKACDAPGDYAGNLGDRKICLRRQQPLAPRMYPLTLVVEFADHARTHIGMPVI